MGEHRFEASLAASWPPENWQDVTVVVAVSGGSDSVALLRGLAALKKGGQGRLLAAHVNHQLRGSESEADALFVAKLCEQLEVGCEIGRIDVCGPSDHAERGEYSVRGQSLEGAARRARYAFLQQTAARFGARYVVTAHTADDQAETILHRILRGTGIRGLAGMSRTRRLGHATLVRPLLGFRRADLAAYLADLGQPCRYDSSNADTRFTRNRIRRHLLPLLAEQFNGSIMDALLRLGQLAGESQDVIDRLMDDLATRSVLEAEADHLRVDCRALASQSAYVVRELFAALWRRQGWPMQAMGFEQWEQLARMAMARGETSRTAPKKVVFPGNVVAKTVRSELCLTRGHTSEY